MNIIIEENALPLETCQSVVKLCEKYRQTFSQSGQQIEQFKEKTLSYKLLHFTQPEPWSSYAKALNYARFLGQKKIIEHYKEWCVPDNTELTRWKRGDSMTLHCDNAWQPDAPDDIKSTIHPTHYRTYSAIFYLSECNGGNFYFKDFDLKVEPKPGLMLCFPAGIEYTHGVEKIYAGKRYTIAVWYTNQLGYAE